MQQWRELVATGKTDPSCSRFFVDLLPDVEALAPDGSGASPALAEEVDILAHSGCDDTVAESPHSIANQISGGSNHSLWVWIAATMRCAQNVESLASMVSATDSNLQSYWDSWKNVTKAEGRGQQLSKKVKTSVFLKEVSTQPV